MSHRARVLPAVLVALAIGACGADEPSSEVSADEDGTASLPMQGLHGRAPAEAGGVPSIVMLTPADPADPVAPTGQPEAGATVDQFGLVFSPTRLIAGVGQPVVFTNSESAVAHNVRVRALADSVDLLDADANPGEQLVVELPHEGGYDVLCDMHPGMTAFIFATDAAHAAFADTDGTYTLDAVPPGSYRLVVWTTDGGFGEERTVEVGSGATRIDLDVSG